MNFFATPSPPLQWSFSAIPLRLCEKQLTYHDGYCKNQEVQSTGILFSEKNEKIIHFSCCKDAKT